MKQVYLDFHHRKFDHLSERSIRQFMRKVATAVRQAQLRELQDFVFAQDIEYSHKRSIADRLANASRDAPAYYVEKIEKGSLLALFSISLALLAYLAHEPAIDLIDDPERRRQLLRNLKRYAKHDWASATAVALKHRIEGCELGSHIVADKVRISEGGSKIVLDIKLVTERDPSDPPLEQVDTPKTIERALKHRLDDIDPDAE